MIDIDDVSRQLVDYIRDLGSVVVAFSGGVDSSVVAAAAVRAFQSDADRRCIAVTASSASLASWQSELAETVAAEIGIGHRFVSTDEQKREGYRRNHSDRCFYCKQTLYEFLQPIAHKRDAAVLSGTNASDLGDYRPGIQAGIDANVRTPLADLGVDKSTVRLIASHFGLSNWDLPASPCLSSRIEYGVEVTPKRLGMIDAAESWLRKLGLPDLRVRLHAGELARIEIPKNRFEQLMKIDAETELGEVFGEFGFRYVTLDLIGLRSGSMNVGLVQIGTGNQYDRSSDVADNSRMTGSVK